MSQYSLGRRVVNPSKVLTINVLATTLAMRIATKKSRGLLDRGLNGGDDVADVVVGDARTGR